MTQAQFCGDGRLSDAAVDEMWSEASGDPITLRSEDETSELVLIGGSKPAAAEILAFIEAAAKLSAHGGTVMFAANPTKERLILFLERDRC